MAEDIIEKIRVYELIDPQKLIDNEGIIKQIFFKQIKVTNGDDLKIHSFKISPLSGWISYSNNAKLFQTDQVNPFPQLITAKKIIDIAETFFRAVSDSYRKNEVFKKLKLPSVFPDDPKLISTTPVFQSKIRAVDHWLCQFEFLLRPSIHEQKSRVIGTFIDVRVSLQGDIIGINSQWRPLSGKTIETERKKIADNNSSNNKNLTIVYLVGDENVPNSFVSPFYFSHEGENAKFIPASDFSLSLGIGQIPNDKGTTLVPLIDGGSGNYKFSWAAWEPDKIYEKGEGIKSMGSDVTINIPTGVFNVVLQARDLKTNAITQTESMVFSTGKISGCMNPKAVNFNPLANFEDGSCVFQQKTV